MDSDSYRAFAKLLADSGVIRDPWLDGKPRLQATATVLPMTVAQTLSQAAERVTAVYDAACLLVQEKPSELDAFFGLTPWQKKMWLASAPVWHGVARADVFLTAAGPQVAELNCDTPTGEPEAIELGRVCLAHRLMDDAEKGAAQHLLDPNDALADHMRRMLLRFFARVETRDSKVAGIVYPTEFPEDLAVIALYRTWLEALGFRVVVGSPYNLGGSEGGKVQLLGEPIDLLVRHYKTDWWSERSTAFLDDEVATAEPLAKQLELLIAAVDSGLLAVVNPLGSVLAQNKRMMAFFWERIHLFGTADQQTIRELVPLTMRLESAHPAMIKVQKDDWVLKSDYGAEGDEVVVGKYVTEAVWQASLKLARPGRFIVQRYFSALASAEGHINNYGVFVVGGEAAGIYLRSQPGPTDAGALSVPVLLRAEE
jgi:glutathionylspermidine synthase